VLTQPLKGLSPEIGGGGSRTRVRKSYWPRAYMLSRVHASGEERLPHACGDLLGTPRKRHLDSVIVEQNDAAIDQLLARDVGVRKAHGKT